MAAPHPQVGVPQLKPALPLHPFQERWSLDWKGPCCVYRVSLPLAVGTESAARVCAVPVSACVSGVPDDGGSVVMYSRDRSWTEGNRGSGEAGDTGDTRDGGVGVGGGGPDIEGGGARGGEPSVGDTHGGKSGGNDGDGVTADATARAQALVEAARFRLDASVVAGLADTYEDEVVSAWLFGAADARPPANNMAAEGLLFTAAYQDTASGRQCRSSEVALVHAHQPPYVLGSIIDAGGPHPVASVGSVLTGVPFGDTTLRRRWAVDLSSPVLEMVEAAVTGTGGLIVVERCIIPTHGGAPTLHEAVRFYASSRVGAAADGSGGRPGMGTGLLQILVRPWGRHDVCTACDPRGGPVAQPCVHAIRRVRGLRHGTFRRWCISMASVALVGQLTMEVVPLAAAGMARGQRTPGIPAGSVPETGSTSGEAFRLRPVGYSYSFRLSDAAVLLWSDIARTAILGGGEHGLSSVLQLGDPSPRLPRRCAAGAGDTRSTETGDAGGSCAPQSLPVRDRSGRACGSEDHASWGGSFSDDPSVAGLVPRTVEPPLFWSVPLSWPISESATGSAAVASRDAGALSASGNYAATGRLMDNHSRTLGATPRSLGTSGDPARPPLPGATAVARSGPRLPPVEYRSDKATACTAPKASVVGLAPPKASVVGLAAAGMGSAISDTDIGRRADERSRSRPTPPPLTAAQPVAVPEWTGAVSSTALRAALVAMTATARERLASNSRAPPPEKKTRATAKANDKPGTTKMEGVAVSSGHQNGTPAQRTSAEASPAAGGTTETDSGCKTGGSSTSGSAHGSGGSQSRPATGTPPGPPPQAPATAVVGGGEATPVTPAAPAAPAAPARAAAEPPAPPPAATGGGGSRPKRPRNFGCVACEAFFLSASDRDRHVNTVHHRRRDWPCSQCDFRGLQRAHLKTHVAARHGGERRFVCPHCDDGGGCAAYRSISRSAVERHVRRVHQHLRPFTCTAECGATFAARSDLTRHIQRRHPGSAASAEEGSGPAAGPAPEPPGA